MGFFDSAKREEQLLGNCFVCGKEIVNTKMASFGKSLADGECLCTVCIHQKQLKIDTESTKAKLLNKIKANGFVTPDEFTPTKRITKIMYALGSAHDLLESFIEIDEARKLINIPEVQPALFSKDKRVEHIRRFQDLIDFELLSNGVKLADGNSLLGAAVGGMAFGGFGAVVGSGFGSKTVKDVCKSLSIKVVFNDLNNPNEYINIITSDTKTDSNEYKAMFNIAQECLSLLVVILKNNQEKNNTNSSSANQVSSVADEIKKYKELLDIGAITEEEFNSKKKQLLGM